MRLSRTLLATMREPPAGAMTSGQAAVLQAGLAHEVDAGVHVHAPMLRRVLFRLEAVIRQELRELEPDEVATPTLLPADRQRADVHAAGSGYEVRDPRGTALELSSSAAGPVDDYVAARLSSYRQLPVRVLTCGRRFRDSAPGHRTLLAAREATMLEAFTYDADAAASAEAYRALRDALVRSLERCDIAVELARSEPDGGVATPALRLVAPADGGGTRLLISDSGGYAALPDVATSRVPAPPPSDDPGAMRRASTPGARTIAQLRATLGDVDPARMLKTMLYLTADGTVVAALTRGDRQIHEGKLSRYLGDVDVGLADEATIRDVTGAEPGFAGPVGLPDSVRIVADRSVADLGPVVCGANVTDEHLVGVRFGRDLPEPELADLDATQEGDAAPDGGRLRALDGYHVGDLAPRAATGPTFVDHGGEHRPTVTWAARIDLERTVLACLEQHDRDPGIRWPLVLAPHAVVVIQARSDDAVQTGLANDLYERLTASGVDVVWDDRDARIGVKFHDADLLGPPIRVVVGRDAADGRVEMRGPGADRDGTVVDADLALAEIVELVRGAAVPPTG